MLLSIFRAFGLLLERVLTDLSPVVQAETENSEKVHMETKSVPSTNTVSERDFAKFDRLIRDKPNASTLALEAHILFTNNKTSTWFRQKTDAERAKIMQEARTNASHFRTTYRQRILEIEHKNLEQQQEKEKKNEEAERKLTEAKEKTTSEIINYGLWQSIAQIDSCLDGMNSESQKRVALKVQLRFRKTVLQQQAPAELYRFSSKEKGQFTSNVLREHLVQLVQGIDQSQTTESSLTGKVIKHRFEENGKQKFYQGRVISHVPGFLQWFNVVYTNEPDIIYTFKLSEDIERGDLQIL
jgi:hypothetical protein